MDTVEVPRWILTILIPAVIPWLIATGYIVGYWQGSKYVRSLFDRRRWP